MIVVWFNNISWSCNVALKPCGNDLSAIKCPKYQNISSITTFQARGYWKYRIFQQYWVLYTSKQVSNRYHCTFFGIRFIHNYSRTSVEHSYACIYLIMVFALSEQIVEHWKPFTYIGFCTYRRPPPGIFTAVTSRAKQHPGIYSTWTSEHRHR